MSLDINKININLKKKFVGLDKIIDDLCKYLSYWYEHKSEQTSPFVINLWGITGTAKTQLVRELINEAGLRLNEFDIRKSKSDRSMIETFLKELSNPSPVILLDEFQNIVSKKQEDIYESDHGSENIWSLLNDGRLDFVDSINAIKRLTSGKKNRILKTKSYADVADLHLYSSTLGSSVLEFYCSMESAPMFGRKLWKFIEETNKKLSSGSLNKSLIFVTGNLDKAYSSLFNAPIDFFEPEEIAEKINSLTISDCREALLKSGFRAEQIARLGGIHMLMPCLTTSQYLSYIDSRLKSLESRKVKFDTSVREYLLDQGVIPSQGMRNLNSTLKNLESNIFQLKVSSKKNTVLELKVEGQSLVDQFGNKSELIYTKNYLVPHEEPFRSIVATHEAGHAILYYLTTNKCPKAIFSKSPQTSAGGYMKAHEEQYQTKKMYKDRLIYTLGGLAAETIEYGADEITSGASSDLIQCASIAGQMINSFGMGTSLVPFSDSMFFKSQRTDEETRDKEVAKLVKESFDTAKKLLEENKDLLKRVSSALKEKTKITESEFKKIIEEYNSKKAG